jgi:hypothetical protein
VPPIATDRRCSTSSFALSGAKKALIPYPASRGDHYSHPEDILGSARYMSPDQAVRSVGLLAAASSVSRRRACQARLAEWNVRGRHPGKIRAPGSPRGRAPRVCLERSGRRLGRGVRYDTGRFAPLLGFPRVRTVSSVQLSFTPAQSRISDECSCYNNKREFLVFGGERGRPQEFWRQ